MNHMTLKQLMQSADMKVVEWNTWLADRENLAAWRTSDIRHRVAVIVTADVPTGDPSLKTLVEVDEIIVNVLSFVDGRVFSLAALIRGKVGFKGVLHVCGDFLTDQVPFFMRMGFDSVLGAGKSSLSEYYSGFYQPQASGSLLSIRQVRNGSNNEV